MKAVEFRKFRSLMGKSQRQLAQLLGISAKAVQSFEQGWRRIPAHIERQFLFLIAMALRSERRGAACWTLRGCTAGQRMRCPAWEFNAGDLCWFINGTICCGRPRQSWERKMAVCRQCEVFGALFHSIPTRLKARSKSRNTGSRMRPAGATGSPSHSPTRA